MSRQTVESLYWTVKRIKGHHCKLVEEVEPIAKYIKSGWFVPFRRAMKKFLTINENDPLTKTILKSSQKIRLENMRHLDKYYWMVHPFSDARFYWNATMSIVYQVQIAFVPMFIMLSGTLALDTDRYPTLMLLQFFCALDVFFTFFIGYYDEVEHEIVLDSRRVAKKYITSYFFFDVIALCQMNLVGYFTGLFEPEWFFNVQWFARFVRITKFTNYSNNFGVRWNMPRYVLRIFSFLSVFIIFSLWISIILVFIRGFVTKTDTINTFHSFLMITLEMAQSTFFVQVPKSMSNDPWYGMFVHLSLLFAGFFVKSFIAAQILQVYNCRVISRNKYTHLMNQIRAYTRFKQVPQQIINRIKSYVEFKFQKTVFKEKIIMESLSNSLRNEILWHLCQNFITRVEIFKDIPPKVMMKLVMLLNQEIYLPNDVVVQSGEVGSEMYFIYVGVLAVYTPTGKEICHLTDGDHFGEIALLLNETRVASVIAIDFCELYRLTKRDFNEALEAYPAAKMRIIQLGEERFKETVLLNQQDIPQSEEEI